MKQHNKLKRNSNFELLRVISMFAIILGHFSYHGNFNLSQHSFSINKVFLEFVQFGGDFGINCFVMISSYFMVEWNFKVERVIKISYKVWSYSVGFIIIFVTFKIYNQDLYTLIKSIFPILSNLYWFATSYIIFYILVPFINIFIKSINRNIHFRILCICLTLWCIIPTITPFELMYNELSWFITLYILISYIKIYEPKITSSLKVKVSIIVISFLTILISVIVLTSLADKISVINKYITFFERRNRIPTVLFSLSVFLIFKDWKFKYKPYINLLGSATFGVYLIHDNPLMRNVLWNDIFKNNQFFNSNLLWIYAFIVALIILIFSSLIDIIKQNSIDKLMNKIFIKIKVKNIIID
ncbi:MULTISPECIES: acyltransferase family protein [Clostridia]|uniref:Acyltransferase n=2 Tax=Clostridia TaxID=186801 RepID=A0A8I0A7I3_9CLOT|nr:MULTISPECIES: acyltransferase [Clostridia]MBC5639006.1 acyltransferase [Clostridium lentum]MBC5653099.1 acyltransferase [Blautia lenta]OKZ87668.1 MAG: hypothetical protein BHW04_04555 [Clostridium sp. 29_15]